MLKRSRVPSPIPDFPSLQPEPILEISERLTKRRRHLGPPTNNSQNGDGAAAADEEDDDTWLEDEGRPEYTRGLASWQEVAGLYKTANTLLHDLHAEQRHRMMFSPSQSAPTSPFARLDLATSSSEGSTSQWRLGRPKSPSFLNEWPVIPPRPQHSMKASSLDQRPLSEDGNRVLSDAETQMVNHRYGDANRFLGTLFLSRRRTLDTEGGPGGSH